MTEFFLTVMNMSIAAGWIVFVLLLLRPFLKKAPKWITVTLWGIAAIRLICPFSFESSVSLIPSAHTIDPKAVLHAPAINSGVTFIDHLVNPVLEETTVSFQPEKGLNLFQFILPYIAGIYLLGIAVFLIYTVISYGKLKRSIGTAVLLRDRIYQSESVASPFVLGIIKPKIYLPFQINEQDINHIIAHEEAHIHRKDHLWKPFGFLILSLHWFNPLVWLGYILFCRDIEFACDEKVIKALNSEQKADYSQALLTCSVNRRMISACPLAFGELGVKQRIRSVLRYQKPSFWIILVALTAGLAVAICFLTNPKMPINDEMDTWIKGQIAEHHQSQESFDRYCIADYTVLHTDQAVDHTILYLRVFYQEYSFAEGEVKAETGSIVPTVISLEEENASYRLAEYWEPRDGAFYDEDIKAKFPWYLHRKAFRSESNAQEQIEQGLKEAKEYFVSFTPIGGADGPDSTVTVMGIEGLKRKFPSYFDLSASKGLEVYVWQMGKDLYSCGLLPKTSQGYSDKELLDLHKAPASMGEMANIVASYIQSDAVLKEDVTVHAFTMPFSSYAYTINFAYIENLNKLFWSYLDPLLQESTESQDEWIRIPTKIYFPEAEKHKFYKTDIQTYAVENDTVFGYTVYHRLFKHCLDCDEIVEAAEHYPCQINDRLCQGGCLNGLKKSE